MRRPRGHHLFGAIVGPLSVAGFVAPLASNVRHSRDAGPPRIGARLAAIRPALGNEPAAEYLTDLPPGPQATGRFLEAQYALAPHLLEQGTAHRFVVIDLADPAMAAAVCRGRGLAPVVPIVGGVGLLRSGGAE